MKCPKGQGWDQDNCKCALLPECDFTEEMVKCKFGEKFNKMTCACAPYDGKIPGKGGKTGEKAIEEYEKIVEEMEA